MGPCGASRFIPVDSAFGIDLVQNLLKMYVKVATLHFKYIFWIFVFYPQVKESTRLKIIIFI